MRYFKIRWKYTQNTHQQKVFIASMIFFWANDREKKLLAAVSVAVKAMIASTTIATNKWVSWFKQHIPSKLDVLVYILLLILFLSHSSRWQGKCWEILCVCVSKSECRLYCWIEHSLVCTYASFSLALWNVQHFWAGTWSIIESIGKNFFATCIFSHDKRAIVRSNCLRFANNTHHKCFMAE